jgi:chemotaxis protein MotA
MDLGTLIGLIGAIVVFIFAILIGSGLGIFINVPGIFIVFGGTIGVILMRYRISTILTSFKVAIQTAFFEKTESPKELIDLAIEIGRIAQKDGVLALEGKKVKNKFFEKGLGLLVDGHDPEFIGAVLGNEMRKSIKESEEGETLLRSMGDSAPAMGMIGTLVGLVQMLATMDDPSAIGPAMAVALLTTLYGSLIAQMFAIPLADKLGAKSQMEKDTMELIIESVTSITKGVSPRVMQELLETYLPGEQFAQKSGKGAKAAKGKKK